MCVCIYYYRNDEERTMRDTYWVRDRFADHYCRGDFFIKNNKNVILGTTAINKNIQERANQTEEVKIEKNIYYKKQCSRGDKGDRIVCGHTHIHTIEPDNDWGTNGKIRRRSICSRPGSIQATTTLFIIIFFSTSYVYILGI